MQAHIAPNHGLVSFVASSLVILVGLARTADAQRKKQRGQIFC